MTGPTPTFATKAFGAPFSDLPAHVRDIPLLGVVGSTAYNLDTERSDVDMLGVYVAPPDTFIGLYPPIERNLTHVATTDRGDLVLHEVGKFCRLALKANPSVLELLWLPSYVKQSGQRGQQLVDLRDAFLSADQVRDAYFGYATSQFGRLKTRGDGSFDSDLRNRTAKHARHLYRLLFQGAQLWRSGTITVALDDADAASVRAFGDRVASGDIDHAERALDYYGYKFQTEPTVLPDQPDTARVNDWLIQLRRATL